jgi:hypothetical protein
MRPPETAEAKRGARLFLATMAVGLVLSAVVASVWPENMIHTPPEYGMAEAHEDQIQALCAAKAAPELLILGDSRAVAGVAVTDIRAAGIDAKKVALGGTGIFASWASLDRLIDCGVRPKTVVMAFGTGHILDVGALMLRTTGYDLIRGSRASHAYDMASQWEDSRARQLAYKAISIAGTELTLVDLVLLRPALRNVLEQPPLAAHNLAANEEERVDFNTSGGDRLYGRADGNSELPDEEQYGPGQMVPQMNHRATEAIAGLGEQHGFNVLFYVLPVSETARTKLPNQLFETSDAFVQELPGKGVTPMNAVWALPDSDFGDPSHVNARGREKVTADFLTRFRALSGGTSEADNSVTVGPQVIEQSGQ